MVGLFAPIDFIDQENGGYIGDLLYFRREIIKL